MAAKRRWLTRDTVIETAAKMADEMGDVQSVTLAAIARKLNVRSPSLYNHVDGIDDLKKGMALYAVRELVRCLQRATTGQVGRDALLTTAIAYRRFAQKHPGIYALTIRAPDADASDLVDLAQMLLQSLLLMMASLGLEGEDALHAVRGLRALLHGFVSLEVAEGYKMPLSRDESFRRVVGSFVDGLQAAGAEADGGVEQDGA